MRPAPKVPTLLFENRRERGSWRWFSGSVMAHALVIVLLVVDWTPLRLSEVDVRTPGDPGPLGGGGGGGSVRVTYVDLPAWETPPAEQPPEPQRPEDLVIPTPEVARVELQPEVPQFEIPRVVIPEQGGTVVGRGPGTGGGPGAGTGTGGGIGSGTGTGVGSHTGPGTGGEGGDVFPPAPHYVELPFDERPKSVKGKEFRVRVLVSAEGRVESVELEPDIRDRDYRRKLIERIRAWIFAPAYTREGVHVRAVAVVTISL